MTTQSNQNKQLTVCPIKLKLLAIVVAAVVVGGGDGVAVVVFVVVVDKDEPNSVHNVLITNSEFKLKLHVHLNRP